MKASAYLSIFDDWELLETAIASIDPYVDEIIVVDGAYSWLANFIGRSGRDASRSNDAVYSTLKRFESKIRYITGIWENELEKRMAGYAACQNRYIFRVDADEVLFINEDTLDHFKSSNYAVGEMEMPIYVAPGLIRATNSDRAIERQALLFDSTKITPRNHLDYLWLVLSSAEDNSRNGAESAKIYPDPIAFNAHLTHWRSPITAINRARFYVMNYVRSSGDVLWLSHYRQNPEDQWHDLFGRVDPRVVNDVLLGHAIVSEPPNITGFVIRPTPLSTDQESCFSRHYTDMLKGLSNANKNLIHQPRNIATGYPYSFDLSSEDARAPFFRSGIFAVNVEKPPAAVTASLASMDIAEPTVETSIPVEIDGTILKFQAELNRDHLRQSLKIVVWNEDGSAFNRLSA